MLKKSLETQKFLTSPKESGASTRNFDPELDPACNSRQEKIPRLARAKNINGNWKYLIQTNEDEVHQFQVGKNAV